MAGKKLPPEVWAWVQHVARRDHDGDAYAAMAAILTGAYERERVPGDPWAELSARVRLRQR